MSAPIVVVSWSSGKDSTWTLHRLRSQGVRVVGLLTTVSDGIRSPELPIWERVPVDQKSGEVTTSHRVPYPLVRDQAAALEVPLHKVPLPDPCPNDVYEEKLGRMADSLARRGVTHLAYGDLHLADIREYREQVMADWPLDPLFPIWHEPPAVLAREMIDGGVRATIVAVDPDRVDPELCGATWDPELLPADVDPLGENGEFHTFCHDGPGFAEPVEATVTGTYRDGAYMWGQLGR